VIGIGRRQGKEDKENKGDRENIFDKFSASSSPGDPCLLPLV